MAPLVSVLSNPRFWTLLILAALGLLWLAWRRRLRWPPAWFLRLFLVFLALFGLFWPLNETESEEVIQRQILLVDQSDSLALADRLLIQEQAKAWQASAEGRLLVVFGAQAEAVPRSLDTWPSVDGRASDLVSALHLAVDLLGPTPGRVILASDGLATDPAGADEALELLTGQGHTLDVVALSPRQDPGDGFIGSLSVPANLWSGTPFDVIVPVFPPPGGGPVSLQLLINNQAISGSAEPLQENLYRFRVPPQPQGILTLQAAGSFSPDPETQDPFPENNSAFAALQVFEAPRVLFVTAQPGSGSVQGFIQLLSRNSLQVDVISPEQVPTGLAALETYRVIFLHDLLSSQLSQEQMLSLQVFVSRLAGGLVFLGGRSSYTLGGYNNTLLEPMLPVRLEPPPRSQRPPILFLLILDRSASMGSQIAPGEPQPIALAREAAMRAIEVMQPQDWLGVLTFSDDFTWDFPVQQLGSGLTLRQALDTVSRVRPTGSTYMYSAMLQGMAAIGNLPEGAPSSRHVLVLSDGQSYDGDIPAFMDLAQAAQEQGITLSTIALGEEADEETMSVIAEAGNGRFYAVSRADELPRILLYESQAARSENVQAGQTGLRLGETDHPVLSGMRPSDLPLLNGYNALSSKAEEGAEDILVSGNFGDPVLSIWQYGLGRVVAWTSDLGEEWLGDWPSQELAGVFWSQVVRYALVNPSLGPAQVNVQVNETGVVVEAALQDPAGEPVNLAQVAFTYVDPEGQSHTFSLPQVSVGQYRAEIPRPAEGSYRAIVSFSGQDGQRVEVPAPFAVNPPGEWLPADPQSGSALLARWTEMANGRTVSLDEIHLLETQAQEQPSAGMGAGWRWLLLALVLLWPLEIAIRRKWLPWVSK